MEFRRFQPDDLHALREIHRAAAYSFDFPDLDKMISSYVAVEDGRVVAWAGAHLMPEVTMMIDPGLSPHWKLGIVRGFHKPITEDVVKVGHSKAYINLDPKFPTFGRRLKAMGWWEGWKQMLFEARQ